MSTRNGLAKAALLFTACFLLAGCGGSSPSATVKAWANAMNSGKYSDVEKHMTKSTVEMSKQGGESAIKDMSDSLTKNGTLSKVEILSEEITDDRATVKFKVHYKDGSSEPGESTLVKEDGKWKIRIG